MTAHHVLGCCEKSLEIYTVVVIETLVLRVDKRVEENGVYFAILYRGSVFVEILSYQLPVLTI